jgi:hypothetical protein
MESITRVLKSLKMIDDETVQITYNDAVKVNVEDMEELLKQLYTFTGGKRLKRLVVCTKNSSLEMEARHYLQDENKIKKDTIIAEAVVVTSLAQKMMTNFYLKFIKEIFPSKFFTDTEKAVEWLQDQS